MMSPLHSNYTIATIITLIVYIPAACNFVTTEKHTTLFTVSNNGRNCNSLKDINASLPCFTHNYYLLAHAICTAVILSPCYLTLM